MNVDNKIKEELPRSDDRPSNDKIGTKMLWCPFAEILSYKMKTQGKYAGGYPVGAVVHFTAGGSEIRDTMSWGKNQGYAFFGIGRDGKIVQAHAMNEWGHHAGTSSWPGLGSSLSSKLVGIEVCAAGRLEKASDGRYKSWFGKYYGESDVRHSSSKANIQSGVYHAYTDEQEDALIRLLLWMKNQAPDVFNIDYVLGHDEISPNRKNDPGGALSMTMPEFRQLLKKRLAA